MPLPPWVLLFAHLVPGQRAGLLGTLIRFIFGGALCGFILKRQAGHSGHVLGHVLRPLINIAVSHGRYIGDEERDSLRVGHRSRSEERKFRIGVDRSPSLRVGTGALADVAARAQDLKVVESCQPAS